MICVPCTPQNDLCLPGNYCDSTNTCVPGCVDNDDCIGVPTGPVCDAMDCVACTPSQDVCPVGEYCTSSNICEPGCTDDADCALSPVGPLCDTSDNSCVECTPQNDLCPAGEYCDVTNTCVTGCLDADDCIGVPAGTLCEDMQCVPCTPTNDLCPQGEYCTTNNECAPGCTEDADCGGSTVCNTSTNTCVGCVSDSECSPGTVCDTNAGTCIPGCNATQPCAGTDTCCSGTCIDTDVDVENCGACDFACDIANADEACVDGDCTLSACQGNFNDCNDDPTDGCETSQACLCIPGTTATCYTGPAGTNGVGVCADGTKTCNPNGLGYGPCENQVLPSAEICGDDLDNDCNVNFIDVGRMNSVFFTSDPGADLSGDGTGGVDFHLHGSHLEWRPVLVLQEVLDETGSRLHVVLVAGVGHPSHVDDLLFSVRGDADKASCVSFAFHQNRSSSGVSVSSTLTELYQPG